MEIRWAIWVLRHPRMHFFQSPPDSCFHSVPMVLPPQPSSWWLHTLTSYTSSELQLLGKVFVWQKHGPIRREEASSVLLLSNPPPGGSMLQLPLWSWPPTSLQSHSSLPPTVQPSSLTLRTPRWEQDGCRGKPQLPLSHLARGEPLGLRGNVVRWCEKLSINCE